MLAIAPTIYERDFPEEEQGYIQFINSSLFELGWRCREFRAALALYDMCLEEVGKKDHPPEKQELYSLWPFIAARDAVGSIYRFDDDIAVLGTNINKCPMLLGRMDVAARKEATRLFSRSFPGFEPLRNSTHHGGVIYQSPERYREHSSGAPFFITNCMVGRTLLTTYNKREVSIDISEETASKLEAVRDRYWDAFWPLDARGNSLRGLFVGMGGGLIPGQQPPEDKSDHQ